MMITCYCVKAQPNFKLLLLFIFMLSVASSIHAQRNSKGKSILAHQGVQSILMKDYTGFKKSTQMLTKQMNSKRVVALGEGTHGTAEFYKLRAWVSQTLIEESGFNYVAFENDFSDAYLLNAALADGKNLDSLMRRHLLSIWQNQEVKEFLIWVKQYNAAHKKKVVVTGLDYVMLRPDLELLQTLLKGIPDTATVQQLNALNRPALFQDAVWEGMNKKDYHYNRDSLWHNGYRGYGLANKLEKKVQDTNLPPQHKLPGLLVIRNIKQAFAPFYHAIAKTKESSRDENMAKNAVELLKDTTVKMIIWAHNGHVAKKGIFNNGVGGMGGLIAESYPNQYFVLGTGTAFGTFAATKDSRDTYTNPMDAYPLEKPIKESWEALLGSLPDPSFYFFPKRFNASGQKRLLRFIGYNPDSGKDTYDQTDLTTLFDAFLFIRDTHAAHPL